MSHDSSDDDIPGLASLSESEVGCIFFVTRGFFVLGTVSDGNCVVTLLQVEEESDDFSSEDAGPDVEDEGPRPPHCMCIAALLLSSSTS